MKIHTGRGSATKSDLYWDTDWYVWNNTGDTATPRKPVRREAGHLHVEARQGLHLLLIDAGALRDFADGAPPPPPQSGP